MEDFIKYVPLLLKKEVMCVRRKIFSVVGFSLVQNWPVRQEYGFLEHGTTCFFRFLETKQAFIPHWNHTGKLSKTKDRKVKKIINVIGVIIKSCNSVIIIQIIKCLFTYE